MLSQGSMISESTFHKNVTVSRVMLFMSSSKINTALGWIIS